jgi:CO/xanthine dehydrogenase FAD-binding subunit
MRPTSPQGRFPMSDYYRPDSLATALAALAERRWTILAGGTDFYPARVGQPVTEDVLDITRIAGLGGIRTTPEAWRIGALVRWSELVRADLPPLFDGLGQAAREVGGVQIQNAATLAGNLCNASPAADGIPNLLAMDAAVELASVRGTRVLPLGAFVTGNRRTARAPDELLTGIIVPRPAGATLGRFLKLGARRYLVISIVMVALVLELDAGGAIARSGIAMGACSPVAQRLPALERRLLGRRLDEDLAALVTPDVLAPLAPIDDVRATAAYRLDAALTLLRRGLAGLGQSRHVAA